MLAAFTPISFGIFRSILSPINVSAKSRKKGFFKKTVVDLGLDKIQSISYGVPGLIAGIFGYGTILIQTGVGDLVISEVKTPAKIYDKLQNVMKGNEK